MDHFDLSLHWYICLIHPEWNDLVDGVYAIAGGPPVFRRLPAPYLQTLEELIQTISQRIGNYLERAPTCRIAVGPG